MTTNFPAGLDNFVNPAPGTSPLSTTFGGRTHSQEHGDLNDAVEALEVKVGVNSSADTNSLDYKINHITGGVAFSGDVFSNGVANTQRNIIGTTVGFGSGTLLLGGFISGKSFTAANVTTYVSAGGSGATLLKYGIYSLTSGGNGTLIASTANQSAGVASSGKLTYALTVPVALVAGNAYAVAMLCVTGTQPTRYVSFALGSSILASGQNPFLVGALNGQTDLPASFTFAGLSSFPTNAIYMEVTT